MFLIKSHSGARKALKKLYCQPGEGGDLLILNLSTAKAAESENRLP